MVGRFVKNEHVALHPGRSASIEFDGKVIGFIGELHPRLQQKYDLPLAPVVFEVDVTALQQVQVPSYQEISKFQAVTRDLALVVKQTVVVQNLLDVFKQESQQNEACKIVQGFVLFDEYRGKGLPEGQKSLAFRVTMQDTQSTLQDESVDAAMAALAEAVHQKHGATIRK